MQWLSLLCCSLRHVVCCHHLSSSWTALATRQGTVRKGINIFFVWYFGRRSKYPWHSSTWIVNNLKSRSHFCECLLPPIHFSCFTSWTLQPRLWQKSSPLITQSCHGILYPRHRYCLTPCWCCAPLRLPLSHCKVLFLLLFYPCWHCLFLPLNSCLLLLPPLLQTPLH